MYAMMKKILVVDDNTAHLNMINRILKPLYKVYTVDSGKTALKFLQKYRPDLILLDWEMPEMKGIDFAKIIKSDENFSDIPVIFLTFSNKPENELQAFELGAVDYIHKPVNSMLMLARVKLHLELESYRKELKQLVDAKTAQITLLQKITIEMLARVTEFCDKDMGHHAKRTVEYVCAIMDNLPQYAPESYHISKPYYDDIKKSTPLHDIGKISIPDLNFLKPGSLTAEEYEIIKIHSSTGACLLKDAIKEFNGPSFLDVTLEIVLTHHEKWDGTGYPNNLKGEEIPLPRRIMAIADVYDALTSKRPYKPAFSHEKAMEIITAGSGTHFDPILVGVFINIQDIIGQIAAKYREAEL